MKKNNKSRKKIFYYISLELQKGEPLLNIKEYEYTRETDLNIVFPNRVLYKKSNLNEILFFNGSYVPPLSIDILHFRLEFSTIEKSKIKKLKKILLEELNFLLDRSFKDIPFISCRAIQEDDLIVNHQKDCVMRCSFLNEKFLLKDYYLSNNVKRDFTVMEKI